MLVAVLFDRAALTMRNLAISAVAVILVSPQRVDAAYLAELALLENGEPHAHVQRKAEDLEARLAEIERSRIRALMRRFA